MFQSSNSFVKFIVFGQKANYFIQEGTAKSLCGLEDIGFLSVEILKRQSDGHIVEEYSVVELERLDFRNEIENDLNKITLKRKNIFNLNFKNPILMGVLNVTPDSFSDGGEHLAITSAIDHALVDCASVPKYRIGNVPMHV